MRRFIMLFILVFTITLPWLDAMAASVSAGVKSWYGLARFTNNGGSYYDGKDSTLLIGPSIKASFEFGAFVGANYMVTTSDYEVDTPAGKVSIDRKDLDLIAGYAFNEHFALFAGYKKMTFNGEFDMDSNLLGISVGTGIGETWTVNGSYAMGNYKDDNGAKGDVRGGELLISKLLSDNFILGFGYKDQSNSPDVESRSFSFRVQGPILNLDYRF